MFFVDFYSFLIEGFGVHHLYLFSFNIFFFLFTGLVRHIWSVTFAIGAEVWKSSPMHHWKVVWFLPGQTSGIGNYDKTVVFYYYFVLFQFNFSVCNFSLIYLIFSLFIKLVGLMWLLTLPVTGGEEDLGVRIESCTSMQRSGW